jgi:membrane-associated phospholipid phosphatase
VVEPQILKELANLLEMHSPKTVSDMSLDVALVNGELRLRTFLKTFTLDLIDMDNCGRLLERRLLLGTLICALLLIVSYFILVDTPMGHQFDDDAVLSREALSRKVIRWDSDVLGLVGRRTLLLAAVATLLIAAVRRCSLVGVIAVAGFECAVAGAELLKKLLIWRTLVPKDALLERGFQTNTYPSGHTTFVTSVALGLLLVSPSRWRPWLAVAGGCVSAAAATGVLFAGLHRPSDALGALAWSGLCMSAAAVLVVRLRGRPRPAFADPGRAAYSSVTFGLLAIAVAWLICTAGAPEAPLAGLSFFVPTSFIIVTAFTLITWYGWQLRAVDWPAESADLKG